MWRELTCGVTVHITYTGKIIITGEISTYTGEIIKTEGSVRAVWADAHRVRRPGRVTPTLRRRRAAGLIYK